MKVDLGAIARRNAFGVSCQWRTSDSSEVTSETIGELVIKQALVCLYDWRDDDDTLRRLIELYSDMVEVETATLEEDSKPSETFAEASELEKMLGPVFIAGFLASNKKPPVSDEYLAEKYAAWPDIVKYKTGAMYPVKIMQDIAYLSGCHEGMIARVLLRYFEQESAKEPSGNV